MLSARQVELLHALVNRVIPPDEDPGGWEAGVGEYLFRQFERDLKSLLPMYVLGLDALDAEAQAIYRLSFDHLPTLVKDELLTRIEAGKVVTLWSVNPVIFFNTVVAHCAEGYYADPGNGGNIGGVSWSMIGFEVRG
jgi:hypothetical protein